MANQCSKWLRWVGLGAIIVCYLTTCQSAWAASALEVPLGSLSDGRTATENLSVTQAIELPLLAMLSFRDAGRPNGNDCVASNVSLLSSPEVHQVAVEHVAIDLPGSGYPLWGSELVNRTHERFLPPSAIRTSMQPILRGSESQEKEDRYKLDIDGSIAFGTGKATYSDREYQEFELTELLTTRSGKEYGFSQRYDVEHMYVNSGRLGLGAKQFFPKLLWQGDFKLEQEYTQYTDRNASANDYRQGQVEMRFTPEWNNGVWKADARYKYRIRDYDEFSSRSYKLHDGLLSITHEFNEKLTGEAYSRLTDYNYSYGSTRDNTRMATGGIFDWQPTEQWRFSGAIDSEEKTYSAADYRDYTQLSYEANAEFRLDNANTFEAKGELRDHQRSNFPSASYEDIRMRLRWQRELGEKLDVELRIEERQKEYDTEPINDYDTHSWRAQFNCYPTHDWNVYGSLSRDDYDYTNPVRAFERTINELGARYRLGRWDLRADWRRGENICRQETDRDYTRDDYRVEASWRLDGQRVRVYYGIGRLAQVDPASRNEYDETRCGARWNFELDSQTELAISYDYIERAYDVRDNIENSRLETRINFEL